MIGGGWETPRPTRRWYATLGADLCAALAFVAFAVLVAYFGGMHP